MPWQDCPLINVKNVYLGAGALIILTFLAVGTLFSVGRRLEWDIVTVLYMCCILMLTEAFVIINIPHSVTEKFFLNDLTKDEYVFEKRSEKK